MKKINVKNCRIRVYVFIEHKYINSLDCIRLLSNDSTVSSKTMSDDSVSNQSSRVSHSVGNRVGNGNRTGNSVGNGVGNAVTNNTVGKSVTDNSVGNTSNNSSLSKVASEARLGSVAHRVGGSDGGDGGTEALGLAGSPDLTLEGLGH